jgi:hypothetical protein
MTSCGSVRLHDIQQVHRDLIIICAFRQAWAQPLKRPINLQQAVSVAAGRPGRSDEFGAACAFPWSAGTLDEFVRRRRERAASRLITWTPVYLDGRRCAEVARARAFAVRGAPPHGLMPVRKPAHRSIRRRRTSGDLAKDCTHGPDGCSRGRCAVAGWILEACVCGSGGATGASSEAAERLDGMTCSSGTSFPVDGGV